MSRYLILSCIIVALAGCDNISPEPDYRDAFEGIYIGTRTNSSWMLGEPSNITDEVDTVEVVAVADSSLLIDAYEVVIPPSGAFWEQGMTSASSYYSVRFFAEDSINLETNSGGLGGGFHSLFSGKKN